MSRRADGKMSINMNTSKYIHDTELAKRCLRNEKESINRLYEELQPRLRGKLLRKGASAVETEDILQDIWGELFPHDGGQPLLASYSGRSSLFTWLSSVAVNRFIDLKRRENRRKKIPFDEAMHLPVKPVTMDTALRELLHRALHSTFINCDAESMVLLRLVYIHDVSQRDIGNIWGWNESKVSRFLKRALKKLKETTLDYIRKYDTNLELEWNDILDICKSSNLNGVMG